MSVCTFKMAQQAQMLASEPEGQSEISETHIVREKIGPHKVPPDLHMYAVAYMHTHIN